MNDSKIPEYKIVLTGDFAVGKSSLIYRYIKNKFDEHPVATIGAAFNITRTPNDVKIGVWDTAGQERYKSLLPMYYRGSHLILYCIDSTKNCDLNKISKEIKEMESPFESIFFIVTKCDIKNKKIPELENFSEKVYYTSSKTGEGVENLFRDVGTFLKEIELPVIEQLVIESQIKKHKCCN